MPHTDRRSVAEGHILIGGTGRAGTTLLVQYFTALGFDTGFTLEQTMSRVDPISKAGLEQPVEKVLGKGRTMPYVAKSPGFGRNLLDYLESGELKIKHCIIPMRELGEAAESRREVARAAEAAGKEPGELQRGGLVARKRKNSSQAQESILAIRFHQFLLAMVSHDIRPLFLRFPDFAAGRQDLFTALEPLLVEHGVTREESDAALAGVLNLELVHDLSSARVEP